MFGRPRCREWTPLATQQLRLRSLIQIVGYNIRPPEGCNSPCSFYLTLHHTTMSAPFYTSERVCSPHPKWKEIDSEMTQRIPSTNVVIRIWCHNLNQPTNDETDRHQDTIIQTWGVYFSGLRYIGANLALNFTSDCFKSNTLVFQMHGGYFCSYKSLKLDIIPPENELEHGSMSSESSGKSKTDSKFKLQKSKESRSISPSKFSRKLDREYSKSHSPVERGFKQNFPVLKTSASLNISERNRRVKDEFEKPDDPNHIYEHSPDTLDVINMDNASKGASQEDLTNSKIDLSETAENYDLRNECEVPKYRYFALHFLKSEIRPSYNATKLQKLHLLQYAIKKKQDAVQEIKEKIYKKSAVIGDSFVKFEEIDTKKVKRKSRKNIFELNEDLGKKCEESDINGRVKDKPVSNGPRLALKLNDLLSFKSKPSPFQRKEHVRLTKQLEILRFKRIILSDERDSKLANIRRLKERHAKLFEDNLDEGLVLMQNLHDLSRSIEILKETQKTSIALRELAARSHASLSARKNELLSSLHDLFYIQQKNQQTWTIIDAPLPVCTDENPRQFSASEPVATGYVAQVTCLAAAMLNLPLRYGITLRGSNSCITDTAHKLPTADIPLFARGGDVTLFRYGLFLLNKCIAQLMTGRGVPVTDMRPTLANLQRLLTTHSHLSDTSILFGTHKWLSDGQCPRTQSLRSLVASERGKQNRQFNRFKDAVDGQSPQSAMNRRHRPSRSVGSYNEDQGTPNMDSSTTSIMGSEPNIYNMKLAPLRTLDIENLKIHNSDSEISRLTDEGESSKVIFTLGDDTRLENIETQKLVRLSTNNGDAIPCTACLDDSVKQICSEIESYCTEDEATSENFKEIHQGFDVVKHLDGNIDIAKYMEQRKVSVEIEDVSSVACMTCENNKDGDCDLACAKADKDVIIIPSAEAVLDTGHNDSDITNEIKLDDQST